MSQYHILIHGGYSYNIEGPFTTHEQAVKCRENMDLRTDRTRIVTIASGPGGLTIGNNTALTDGRLMGADTADMADAHAQGLHEGLPREGCPDCEQQGGRRRAA